MTGNGRRRIFLGVLTISVLLVILSTLFIKKRPERTWENVKAARTEAAGWMQQHYEDSTETAGNHMYDWYIFAMGRAGYPAPYEEYRRDAEAILYERYCKDTGEEWQPTDSYRMIFACMAAGSSPYDVKGMNLLKESVWECPEEKFKRQGIMSAIFALLLLHSVEQEGAEETQERIAEELLSYQTDAGGFGMGKNEADVDVTAMAVQALAKEDTAECKEALCKALLFLQKEQRWDASFGSGEKKSAESTAQVVTALCCCNIDPATDERFCKFQTSPVDALLRFRNPDGGFSHEKGEPSDGTATTQALYALEAYRRYIQGEEGIYEFAIYND